jgi:hypothetical protein
MLNVMHLKQCTQYGTYASCATYLQLGHGFELSSSSSDVESLCCGICTGRCSRAPQPGCAQRLIRQPVWKAAAHVDNSCKLANTEHYTTVALRVQCLVISRQYFVVSRVCTAVHTVV